MLRNFDFDYDCENDSLFIYDPNTKSSGSIEMDDFIIDFSKQKTIVGIEILNASNFFTGLEFEKENAITKDVLEEIKECKIDIINRKKFYVIKFNLIFKVNKPLATPIIIPTINETSPSIA